MSKNLKTLLCCILSLVFVAGTIVAVFADSNNFFAGSEAVSGEDVSAEDVSAEETTAEVTTEAVADETTTVVEEETSEAVEEESSEAPEVHEHDFVGVVTAEPTCVEDGVMTYTCACGETYEEAIAATGHNGVWEVVKEAGIGVEGLKQNVCSVCGLVLAEEIIPAIEDESEAVSEEASEEITTAETTTEAVVDETTTVVVDETTTVVVDETTTVVVDETTTVDTTVKSRLGDVNLDGKITAADARLALRISAKLEPDATAEQLYAAEVTGDNKIEAKDARRILRVSAKLDKESDFGKDIDFPIQ